MHYARMRDGLRPVDRNGIFVCAFIVLFDANYLYYYSRLATGEVIVRIDDAGQCCALKIHLGGHL